MTDATFTPPPQPDPVKVAQWAGQLRTLIALLAGAGLLGGVWAGVTAEQIANWLTAILTVAGLAGAVWAWLTSRWAKIQDRKMLVASAKASAQHGTAVVVTETPPGQENTARLISATEQAAAPSVPQGVPPQPAPVGP
jgi:hypothetical protein